MISSVKEELYGTEENGALGTLCSSALAVPMQVQDTQAMFALDFVITDTTRPTTGD